MYGCIYGLPWWLYSKESTCSAGDTGDTGSIPGWGRSPWEGNGYPPLYFCLENSTDRGDWQATDHKVTKSWIQLKQKHLSTHSDKYTYGKKREVASDSSWPRGLYNPRNSPGQNAGVGSLSLLQRIFLTQGLNPGLSHCRRILYQLSQREDQEYWSGWPIPSPGYLPDPRIELGSPALQVDSLPTEISAKPKMNY